MAARAERRHVNSTCYRLRTIKRGFRANEVIDDAQRGCNTKFGFTATDVIARPAQRGFEVRPRLARRAKVQPEMARQQRTCLNISIYFGERDPAFCVL
jgi:hypothetical protein